MRKSDSQSREAGDWGAGPGCSVSGALGGSGISDTGVSSVLAQMGVSQ